MNRRRHTFEPLAPCCDPRWIEIRSMAGALLASQPLPAGVDATAEFIETIRRHLSEGWRVPEFNSRSGMFRAVRGSETRLVYVVVTPPGEHPGFGAAHLTQSPKRVG